MSLFLGVAVLGTAIYLLVALLAPGVLR